MGKSLSSGPDWTDVADMMTALGTYATGSTTVTLYPDPTRGFGAMRVIATLRLTNVVYPTMEDMITCEETWPHRRWRTIEACVMHTLYEVDRKLAAHSFFSTAEPKA